MDPLIEGYRRFRAELWPAEKARYEALAHWGQSPEALVVCQPTWGVDAGAAAAIHQAIVDLAARGSAVMVISQDLDELLTLCDTIAVINLGRLSPPMKVGQVSIEEIGLLMGGVHGDPTATVEMTEAMHAHPT